MIVCTERETTDKPQIFLGWQDFVWILSPCHPIYLSYFSQTSDLSPVCRKNINKQAFHQTLYKLTSLLQKKNFFLTIFTASVGSKTYIFKQKNKTKALVCIHFGNSRSCQLLSQEFCGPKEHTNMQIVNWPYFWNNFDYT